MCELRPAVILFLRAVGRCSGGATGRGGEMDADGGWGGSRVFPSPLSVTQKKEKCLLPSGCHRNQPTQLMLAVCGENASVARITVTVLLFQVPQPLRKCI